MNLLYYLNSFSKFVLYYFEQIEITVSCYVCCQLVVGRPVFSFKYFR